MTLFTVRTAYLGVMGFSFLLLLSCRQQPSSTATSEGIDQIVVRMLAEPETISPILAQSSLAREAYQYLFVSLAAYDYETLELKPILIEEIPQGRISEDGSEIEFEMRFRDEAKWQDGKDITGEDFLTTLKIALHPSIASSGWKSLLDPIISVDLDANDPKKFIVRATNNHFLNREAILSAELYPTHIYDADQIMKDIDISDFKSEEKLKSMASDSAFESFANNFSSARFSKEYVEGAGPYQLESWNTGQYMVLKRKSNYWGAQFDELDQLESVPERIILQFIADEATALTLFKNEEIDLIDLTRSTYRQFDDLKSDESFAAGHDFHTTQLPRYYYLMLNNEDIRLSDLAVRQALGHLINVDRMMEQIEGGYAKRVNSIIHFSKTEYKEDLPFLDYNPEKASELLDGAGWKDSDGDNIRDKIINGRKENLSIRFHISGSNLSSSVSAIIKEGCVQGGVNIEIIKKPNSAVRTENLLTGDFGLYLSQRTQSPVRYDPYSGFHSSAIGTGGLNYMRYSNEEVDELIAVIQETQDEKERARAYDKIQEITTYELPVIFLYSPQLRIISNKSIQPVISAKRPGYFVNATKEL